MTPIESLTFDEAVNAGWIDEYRACRQAARKAGRNQWGHSGSHHGTGTEECPTWRHHHHDAFCTVPGPGECERAGVKIPKGGWSTRGPRTNYRDGQFGRA